MNKLKQNVNALKKAGEQLINTGRLLKQVGSEYLEEVMEEQKGKMPRISPSEGHGISSSPKRKKLSDREAEK